MAFYRKSAVRFKPRYPRKPNLGHPLARGMKWAYGSQNGLVAWSADGFVSPTTITNTTNERLNISHNNGHLIYPVPGWIQGATKCSMFYRFSPTLDVGGSNAGGFQVHDNGVNGDRFGFSSYQDDVYFSCDNGVSLMNILAGAVLTAGETYNLSLRYDGTQSTAGDRLWGWLGNTKYTDTDSFRSSLATTYDRLYLGAYGYGGPAYDYYNDSVVAYLWDRVVTEDEFRELRENPYEIFERRIWVPVTAAAGSTVNPGLGTTSFEGKQSTIFAHKSVAPTLGTASFEGIAPTVSKAVSVLPTVGTASFEGLAPVTTAITGATTSPGLGAASFEGVAPTAFVARITSPTTGTVAFSGIAPTVVLPGLTLPGVGTASFEGLAPATSVFINLLPTTGAMSFEGFTPTAAGVVPGTASPKLGLMGMTGKAPTATADSVFGVWNDIARVSSTWTDIARVSDTWTDI